jgi:hypothetical protein
MTSRLLYVYFMRDRPDLVKEVAPRHAQYWHDLGLPGYSGGPFADRSGGAITFVAGTHIEPDQLVAGDPFVAADLISKSWLKDWQVE